MGTTRLVHYFSYHPKKYAFECLKPNQFFRNMQSRKINRKSGANGTFREHSNVLEGE